LGAQLLIHTSANKPASRIVLFMIVNENNW